MALGEFLPHCTNGKSAVWSLDCVLRLSIPTQTVGIKCTFFPHCLFCRKETLHQATWLEKEMQKALDEDIFPIPERTASKNMICVSSNHLVSGDATTRHPERCNYCPERCNNYPERCNNSPEGCNNILRDATTGQNQNGRTPAGIAKRNPNNMCAHLRAFLITNSF